MDKNIPVYSIIMPLYNEEKTVIHSLEQIECCFSKKNAEYEVILVNDGSIDATEKSVQAKAANNPRIRLLKSACNEGKGSAVRKGILNSRGEYLIFMDADMSVPIQELGGLLDLAKAKNEIIIGIRDEKAKDKKVVRPLARKIVSRAYNLFANFLFNLKIKDIGCGFKCFPASIAKEIFTEQKIKGWVFDTEILLKARQKGILIKELPVSWTNHLVTRVNIIPDCLYCLFDLSRVFYYNLVNRL